MKQQRAPRSSAIQSLMLVLLRVIIGWHFLYEGYVKITAGSWSASGYLNQAQGPLAGFFHHLAASKGALHVVNFLNMWGLAAVGLGLMLGLLTRLSCLGAMLLLALYYAANPPWIAVLPRFAEGNYLVVDKNLVEFIAVVTVFVFDTGRVAGLDLLLGAWRQRRAARRDAAPDRPPA